MTRWQSIAALLLLVASPVRAQDDEPAEEPTRSVEEAPDGAASTEDSPGGEGDQEGEPGADVEAAAGSGAEAEAEAAEPEEAAAGTEDEPVEGEGEPAEGEGARPAIAPTEPGVEPEPAVEAEPAPPVEVMDMSAREPERGVCVTDLRGRPIGPLQVQSGTANGNLGLPHRACPRTELAIGGDALVIAQTSELYGHIRVNGRGRISAQLVSPRFEAFVDWELVRWQTVIRSVASEHLGLGYLSWGVAGQVFVEEDATVAVTGRMLLPSAYGLDQGSMPLGLDLGMTAAFMPDPAVRFHLWVNVLGSIGIGGPVFPRGGARVGGGVDLRAAEWISFQLELGSGFGYDTQIDFVSAQGGVRLGFSDEVGAEIALSFPFLGGVRTALDGAFPLAGSLALAWNLP